MLSVISPAKSLDFESPPQTQMHTQPGFLEKSQQLIAELKPLSPQDLSNLMKISDKLASLNAARYQEWAPPFNLENAKQAALAFTGDVYSGLDAGSLDAKALAFGQEHLRILSGLYGLLRPLDLIQPYRLEMGTRLSNPAGKDLYAFWRNTLTTAINRELDKQDTQVLVNLASQEYFKALDSQQLNAEVITPAFKDWKNGQFKIISFHAKKARGLMSRFILENQIDQPEELKSFDWEGYSYNSKLSEGNSWVYTRKAS
ncbi:peroxide stress protein YaaA [Marinospirillum sp.]|uniref:peroxide stress protein YaaA n=1 Tax=Marinospirillum sp. TaxID=2183934 RepID=UPI0028701D78|nr:peroxide stress protein YaaA [Marinospirillum sp.]MDR9467529.1 peroxide stress protein YaaA [Marinospirillum sp.]